MNICIVSNHDMVDMNICFCLILTCMNICRVSMNIQTLAEYRWFGWIHHPHHGSNNIRNFAGEWFSRYKNIVKICLGHIKLAF